MRRADQDLALQERMADEIRRQFPGCPRERALQIARHTAARSSGRVGRSAAGRALQPDAIELAVIASVRHGDTRYDELLMSGVARQTARARVYDDVASMLDARGAPPPPHEPPHRPRNRGRALATAAASAARPSALLDPGARRYRSPDCADAGGQTRAGRAALALQRRILDSVSPWLLRTFLSTSRSRSRSGTRTSRSRFGGMAAFGKVKISKGAIDWMPANKSKTAYYLNWSEFAKVMAEYERPV
jgi:hypothetical protein